MLKLNVEIAQESLDLASRVNNRKDNLKACMFMLDRNNKLVPDPEGNIYNSDPNPWKSFCSKLPENVSIGTILAHW